MKLNRNTKKAQGFIESYTHSELYSLFACYANPSLYKKMAFCRCAVKFTDMDGWRFRIISYNSYTFTCGWLYEDEETGLTMLNVETALNTYEIEY